MEMMEKPPLTAGPLQVETDLLKTFVAIADTGSFSKAAQRVFRTPSAVSMQVKKLEETLGVSVFERDSRSVSLTASGEVLLSYARRILALNHEMMARFATPEMAGTVRFGASDDYGTKLIPEIFRRFADSHPNVTVDVLIDSSSRLKERFLAGQLDLAFMNSMPDAPYCEGMETIIEEPLVWAGVRCGTAQTKSPLPLAMWEQGCPWRASAVEALDKAGLPYRFAYMSGNFVVQMSAIQADLAIAPIPSLLVEPPLVRLGREHGLPELATTQIRLAVRRPDDCVMQAVAAHVRNCVDAWKAGELDCCVAA